MKNKLYILENKINQLSKLKLIKDSFLQKRSVSGQSSIEFVMVIPFIIIIILIVSQLGYMIYLQNIIGHAAGEASRVIVTTNSNNEASKAIFSICSNLDKKMLQMNFYPSDENSRGVGDMVKTEIAYTYGGIMNIIKLLTGKNAIISGTCIMRMECCG